MCWDNVTIDRCFVVGKLRGENDRRTVGTVHINLLCFHLTLADYLFLRTTISLCSMFIILSAKSI